MKRKYRGLKIVILTVVSVSTFMLAGCGFSLPKWWNDLRGCDHVDKNKDYVCEDCGDELYDEVLEGGAERVIVNETLASAKGVTTLKLSGENEIAVSDDRQLTALGSEDIEAIVINGENECASLAATGIGSGAIRCAADGVLIVKNLTIKNETISSEGAVLKEYLYFGGYLQFENCTFEGSIYLEEGTVAAFIDCKFISTISKRYSVWVAGENVSFVNCTFEGYRALKIHEWVGTTDHVINVSVDGCRFNDISEKVGVVIGEFRTDPKATTVSIKNSVFTNCQPWDRVGSIEGIDGLYEADIYSTEYNLITKNNTVTWNTEKKE